MPIATGQIRNPITKKHPTGPRGPWESKHFDVCWISGEGESAKQVCKQVQVDRDHEKFWQEHKDNPNDTTYYNVIYSGQYDKVDDIGKAKAEDVIKNSDNLPPLPRESTNSAFMQASDTARLLLQLNCGDITGAEAQEAYYKKKSRELAIWNAETLKMLTNG